MWPCNLQASATCFRDYTNYRHTCKVQFNPTFIPVQPSRKTISDRMRNRGVIFFYRQTSSAATRYRKGSFESVEETGFLHCQWTKQTITHFWSQVDSAGDKMLRLASSLKAHTVHHESFPETRDQLKNSKVRFWSCYLAHVRVAYRIVCRKFLTSAIYLKSRKQDAKDYILMNSRQESIKVNTK